MDKVFLFTTASVPLHNVKLFFLDNIALHNMQWLPGLKGVTYVHHPGVKVHVLVQRNVQKQLIRQI